MISALSSPNCAAIVPAGVVPQAGYAPSVFAVVTNPSSKPDSIVQIGGNVLIGVGDDVGPDGTFNSGAAHSPDPTQVASSNLTTGVLKPTVSGLQSPHDLIFVTP